MANSILATLLMHVEGAAAGKSQNQLAAELGIDGAALHRWRKGQRSISIETAEHLAAHFGLVLSPTRKPGRKAAAKPKPPAKPAKQ